VVVAQVCLILGSGTSQSERLQRYHHPRRGMPSRRTPPTGP